MGKTHTTIGVGMEHRDAAAAIGKVDPSAGGQPDGPRDTVVHGIARLPPSPPVESDVDAVVELYLVVIVPVDEVDAESRVDLGAAVVAVVVAMIERTLPAALDVDGRVDIFAPLLGIDPDARQSPAPTGSVLIT